MSKLIHKVADRYLKARHVQGGGVDPNDDPAALLPALAGMVSSMDSEDLAHSAYLFEYLSSVSADSRVSGFYGSVATEYAHRFAEWLGFVFLNRANMTKASAAMKQLQTALETWVEAIPDILLKKDKAQLSEHLPKEVQRFVNVKTIDQIGAKILKVVDQEWRRSSHLKQAGLEEAPIKFNPHTKVYEIPKSNITYVNRNLLRDLGFEFDGSTWNISKLDSKVIHHIPQAANLLGSTKVEPLPDTREWFFHLWLPNNIDRLTKVFNTYGRAEKVPYEFHFSLHGQEVSVTFQRNIKTVEEAIAELESRYGGEGDREGWQQAIDAYRELRGSQGKSAMLAIDHANDLEHSHGSMIEHFPPGVRTWYPKFLDFKYSAHPLQLIKAISDEDIADIAMALLPESFRTERLRDHQTDHRTAKGLALEVAAQPGKHKKKALLAEFRKQYPDLYEKTVQLLEERGLHLT